MGEPEEEDDVAEELERLLSSITAAAAPAAAAAAAVAVGWGLLAAACCKISVRALSIAVVLGTPNRDGSTTEPVVSVTFADFAKSVINLSTLATDTALAISFLTANSTAAATAATSMVVDVAGAGAPTGNPVILLLSYIIASKLALRAA